MPFDFISDPAFVTASKILLAETDDFAAQNVLAGRGGPFGAMPAVYDLRSKQYLRVGDISANAVLTTGVGSDHAEHTGFSPRNTRAIIDTILQWNAEKHDFVFKYESSGQSCQTCHAKEEITARYFAEQGLIKPQRVVVNYGATFEETAKIAKFNDLPYVLDLMRYVQEPQSPVSMVRHETKSIDAIPPHVAALFRQAEKQITVLTKGDQIISTGEDLRTRYDLFSTAEAVAMRRFCEQQNAKKVKNPWVIGHNDHINPDPRLAATLYTTTRQMGPLMRGECQWATVNTIVSITTSPDKTYETQEARGLDNRAFLKIIASGYNQTDLGIIVVRDPNFANKAQHVWREWLDREGLNILYNGFSADPNLDLYSAQCASRFTGIALG